jgi:hypothetical protein
MRCRTTKAIGQPRGHEMGGRGTGVQERPKLRTCNALLRQMEEWPVAAIALLAACRRSSPTTDVPSLTPGTPRGIEHFWVLAEVKITAAAISLIFARFETREGR